MQNLDIAYENLREAAVRCGFFLAVLAALPILMIALPLMLLNGDKVKDGEYWD